MSDYNSISKEDNKYLIQWMASDLKDINTNSKIRQILDCWQSKNPAFKTKEYSKSDLYDFCRYLGLGSMVLKAAKLNLKISPAIFLSENSRLSFGGNLGWSRKDALEILRQANANGLLEEIPEILIDKLESNLRDNKNIIKLNKSIVWFPIVDFKTDMVMFDACYYNKKKDIISSCYTSAGVTHGNSNELAMLIQEFITKRCSNQSICLQYIATGTLDLSVNSNKIGRIDKIIPKLKAALDFGILDIFAPLDNKEECDSCEVLFNHINYSNIHWVNNLEEVNNFINKQYNKIYSVEPDIISKDPFAQQTYQSMFSEKHNIQI